MTPSVRRGLQHAKVYMSHTCMDFARRAVHKDMQAAIKWIERQMRIDDRRRKPRGKYHRRSRR